MTWTDEKRVDAEKEAEVCDYETARVTRVRVLLGDALAEIDHLEGVVEELQWGHLQTPDDEIGDGEQEAKA